ncbi:MAG TPA: hypothetical protein VM328_00940 [Fimbriimonadaceae bacterium]|nr:hypothetical protein [Fimbriimonadaceae bacterium]
MFLNIAFAVAAAQQAPSFNEVTVYNQGFALVKETRELSLRQGRQQVAVENVAAMIEPSSVGIRSLADPASIQVLEQNYQYDLISPLAILNKAVGSQVRFIRVLPNGAKETLTGTLISSPTAVVGQTGGQDWGGGLARDRSVMTYNGMVIRTDDGRIVLNPTGEIEVSTLPEGLISRPTLMWDLVASRAGSNTVELSYLTQGVTWNADYVLTIDELATAQLKGWVTMNNQSGATFREARLKLLAGDVQRIMPQMNRGGMGGGGFGGAAQKDAFQEESLFEYHLYTLQRPATIRDKEIKQLSLLDGSGIKYSKKLVLDAMRGFVNHYPNEGVVGVGNLKPQVRVEFVNSKENGLGMPLPKGKVKVYQRDKSGSVQMLGEDQIDHTPRDERLSLVVGRSFDVAADRRRTNFRRLSPSTVEETFEIEVRNRKEMPETVHVLERHWATWRITAQNRPSTKLDSHTSEFVLRLAPGESQTITYTIVTSW